MSIFRICESFLNTFFCKESFLHADFQYPQYFISNLCILQFFIVYHDWQLRNYFHKLYSNDFYFHHRI
jgi:hypothetical protein